MSSPHNSQALVDEAAIHGDAVRPRPSRLTTLTIILVSIAIALAAALIYVGQEYRRSEQRRIAAVAVTGGDPTRAPAIVARYGCGGCHIIPGVRGASGLVGPSLQQLGQRVYVAGVVTNTPEHLVQWIVNPRDLNPRTAMPVTGISASEARDVAAYLYAVH